MARTTLNELIDVLRSMTQAGTADYTLGTATYWDNDQLQRVLDANSVYVYAEQLLPVERLDPGGSVSYYEYFSGYGNYEQTDGGTALFYIEDGAGNNVGTALFTIDYLNGRIEFTANTSGTVYYLTGRSYDLNAAAAAVWRSKAGYQAGVAIDFSTDNHSFKQSQAIGHCQAMAAHYDSLALPKLTTIYRSDSYVNPE